MRRVVASIALVAGLILSASPANAQLGGTFDVIEVNGLIDPVMADFIDRSLDASEANGAAGVILQMESEGAAISDAEVAALATRIAEFDVPVSVWLGPSGNGRALGGAGQIALAASRIGISPGSEIGDFGESVLDGAALNGPLVDVLSGGFDGEVVGYVTGGAWGHTVGAAVGMALAVRGDGPVNGAWIKEATWTVEVPGREIPIDVQLRPLL